MSRTYTLATPLARVMHAKGLRIIDVTYATGYSHRQVRRWVLGEVTPSADALERLCKALQVTPRALGFSSGPDAPQPPAVPDV